MAPSLSTMRESARVRHVRAPLRQETSSSPQGKRHKRRVDERGVPLARRFPARRYQPPPPQRPRRRDVEGLVVLRPSQNASPPPPRATLLQAQQRSRRGYRAAVERREARPGLSQTSRAHAPAQQRDASSQSLPRDAPRLAGGRRRDALL